ncbi:NAD-dependent epimerase [Sinomicrobium weinanense]|uniref:NAD-dependent epimerase n=1 Tax=Sinomicrobium weinanense TaxID=2842200 RepID=A0A926Q401_9FLAO|nr:NAD-dependent epimerase [Sinomicrobium weinanense]MBC9797454.1 NAD-dependent epimerase [Sinomicrobium weinanense]MBU3125472.1 NAD-dependent epimerase [Sinomicrobium weinanense]
MNKRKILVTGAAGFIGFYMANALLKLGDDVVGLDNLNDYYDVKLKYARLAEAGIKKQMIDDHGGVTCSVDRNNYRFAKIDITHYKKLEALFKEEQFTHVIHLAAQAGVRYSIINPHEYAQSNLVGFLNVLECCRHYGIAHLVYASSSSVYGDNTDIPFSEEQKVDTPVSLYAATKRSNELMAYSYSHLYNLPTTGLRFFTVYGPWGRPDMAPMLFAKAILEGRPIKVFNNGDMQRDFTYIDDIVEGVVKVLEKPSEKAPPVELFNIGNSQPIYLMDFINGLEKCIGKKAIKEFLPMQDGDVHVTYADVSKLQDKINYKPTTTIEKGIEKFEKWYQQYN